MEDAAGSIEVGASVLEVGAPWGMLVKQGPTTTVDPALADALAEPRERRPPDGASAGGVDTFAAATGRAEDAMGHLRAAVEGTTFDAEHLSGSVDLILEVVQRLDREGRLDEALRLARTVNALLALLRRWADLVRSLDIVLDGARRVTDAPAIAWAQHELGSLHLAADDPAGAERRLSEAQDIRRRLNDPEALAATEHNMTQLCRRLRELLREGRLERTSRSRGWRRLLAALAALLLLLAGGVAGAMIKPEDDSPSDRRAASRDPQLAVHVEGTGTVTSRPSGIRCPGRCTSSFKRGTPIALLAEPSGSATFDGWRGVCSGKRTCRRTLWRDRAATATFAPNSGTATYTLSVDPPQHGTVSSAQPGINCGADCSSKIRRGEQVTLIADPVTGYTLDAWGGACQRKAPCVIAMNADKDVSAAFTAVATEQPTVTVSVEIVQGFAAGRVTDDREDGDMNCSPTACSASFPLSDEQVTLTAVPAADFDKNPDNDPFFSEWGGDCASSTTNTCSLSLDAGHKASVTFAQPQEVE